MGDTGSMICADSPLSVDMGQMLSAPLAPPVPREDIPGWPAFTVAIPGASLCECNGPSPTIWYPKAQSEQEAF